MIFDLYDELSSLFFVVGKNTVVFYLTLSSGPGAGWFPLSDAVKEAFGLPPICP